MNNAVVYTDIMTTNDHIQPIQRLASDTFTFEESAPSFRTAMVGQKELLLSYLSAGENIRSGCHGLVKGGIA